MAEKSGMFGDCGEHEVSELEQQGFNFASFHGTEREFDGVIVALHIPWSLSLSRIVLSVTLTDMGCHFLCSRLRSR